MTGFARPRDTHGYTIAELHALPDDYRYELVDGSIIVSPWPTGLHNIIARWVVTEIEAASPTREWIASMSQSVTVDERNEPWPDIVVARTRWLETSPIPVNGLSLVGEVVSTNSALRDTALKEALYARAGVPAYWIVAPDEDTATISLAELRLDGTTYRYATRYTTDVFTTDHPWPITIDLPAISRRWARLLELADRDGGDREAEGGGG